MSMPQVRVIDRSFTTKCILKQINWSHKYDSNKHGHCKNDGKSVCIQIAEYRAVNVYEMSDGDSIMKTPPNITNPRVHYAMLFLCTISS